MPYSTANRWFPFRSGATDVTFRVFCLPHAGGAASSFREWVRNEPPGVEICPIQPPGRESRIGEPAAASIPALGRALATVLLPHLDMPYALVGNSMGALVGYETAWCLQEWYGLPPVRLVAASTRPPGTRLGLPQVSALDEHAFATAIQDRHGGIPDGILRDPEHLAAFLPALRADMAMFESYQPSSGPLVCPVTAVVGTRDPGLTAPEMAGWAGFTSGSFECVELRGDHFAMLRDRDTVLGPLIGESAPHAIGLVK
jgi:surfactin synthase thioesterase subunit